MPTIIIAAIIAIYAGYVIRKKVIDIRNGRFCNCGCENCPSKTCHTKDVSENKNKSHEKG